MLSLGFYVTPALLGSNRNAMIAQVINVRAKELLDFGGAGAMGMLLLVVTLVVLGLSRRLAGQTVAVTAVGGQPARAASTSDRAAPVRPWLRIHTTVVAIILVAPTLVVIPMSFSSAKTFRFPPDGWSLRWYENLFTSAESTTAILNSPAGRLLHRGDRHRARHDHRVRPGPARPRSRGLVTGFLLSRWWSRTSSSRWWSSPRSCVSA